MHGEAGEESRSTWHMWGLPSTGKPAVTSSSSSVLNGSDSDRSQRDFFLKDGRKIRVGDCALFQSGSSPAFIGIIRWFSSTKDNRLKLGVNWLYRPADIKLIKGIFLEAAPNEVFYSFHQDEILAESLLHPCKVAFLRKGVELPSGISSFVCRRVYDIANRCLWWLTDQDYINERQEEVDKLLDKTRFEMHAAMQSGGRSPKSLNGPSSTQQIKSGSDSVQNSGTSVTLQGKGKRREKVEQGLDVIKKEPVHKADDGDCGNHILEGKIKAEVSKVTEKGGLVHVEDVEKLINLMQLDRADRKIDIAGRILLADVISSTDRFDCLGRFVQLRGVPVLDDWLQEAHKGKIGDSSSPKESDRSVEELLVALLRALDKLPVNLHALQTSNIGKSVNHLRSHKNPEIQKKARSLVDTWKKRVDAEMTKTSDAKSAAPGQSISWSGKSGFSELSKGPVTQPSACKNLPVKSAHGETAVKSSPLPAGTSKSSSKDLQCKTTGTSGNMDLQLAAIKEEKSSGSSQSQNNSQSCSSGYAKATGASWKEDAKSSNSGSLKTSKTSGGSSRHRKSNNGLVGTSASKVHKELNTSKSSPFNRNSASSKVSQSGPPERFPDVPSSDHGNCHRLIVRLPNPGRSPARSTSGGSLEEPSTIGSRASSPGASEKHNHTDRKIKVKGNSFQASVADAHKDSWQSGDVKGTSISAEGGRLAMSTSDFRGNINENGKPNAKFGSSSSNEGHLFTDTKVGKSRDPTFSSIDALIESCAKHSAPHAPLSAGDDLGMNLLASVATGEMCKSDTFSPTTSPVGNSTTMEEPSDAAEAKLRSGHDVMDHSPSQQTDKVSTDTDKCVHVSPSVTKEESRNSHTTPNCHGDDKQAAIHQDTSMVDHEELRKKLRHKPDEETTSEGQSVPISPYVKEDNMEIDGADKSDKQSITDSLNEGKFKVKGRPLERLKLVENLGEKITEGNAASGKRSDKKASEEVQLCNSDTAIEQKLAVIEESNAVVAPEENQLSAAVPTNAWTVDNTAGAKTLVGSGTGAPKGSDEMMDAKMEDVKIESHPEPSGHNKDQGNAASLSHDNQVTVPAASIHTMKCEKDLSEKDVINHPTSAADASEDPSGVPSHETKKRDDQMIQRLPECEVDQMERASSANAPSPSSRGPESAAKHGFDLNEGITVDEANQVELAVSAPPRCSSAFPLPALVPFTAPSASNGSPIPVTVAAPAKGRFVAPENLFPCKGEPGWKGSAATSAFRPAEPRKVLEMPLSASQAPHNTNSVKHGRPALDIDLNIPDDRVLEDVATQSSIQGTACGSGPLSRGEAPVKNVLGLDLDLNKMDDIPENGQPSASISRRLEEPLLPARPISGGFPHRESGLRDFDLNNGPGIDDVGAEPIPRSQQMKNSSVPFLPSIGGMRVNNTELGNMSPWFLPGNAYSAVAIPSFLPDRGDQTYPIVAAPGAQRFMGSSGGSFGSDIYRNPVLSSSPAMGFSPATSFPYASFPFGSSFPFASTSFAGASTAYTDSSAGGGPCFPTVPSQLVSSANAAGAYIRPNVMSLQECSTSGGGSEGSRKWGRQGLDLNAGPGSMDTEGRDERLASASRQLSVAGQLAFPEDQARLFQLAGGAMKRKEPEGGREAERYNYKQPSWQ